MAIAKEIFNDKITATEFGDLEIRQVTRIMEDGKELSRSYHRRVIMSGENVSNESQKIQDLYAAAQLDKKERPTSEL